nr:UDP-glycosyltransferase 74E2-like isoform X1 [Ipomoea trifida]
MEERQDVIAVPFPYQGHLNPMFHFCSCLSARGLKVTLVLTHGVAKSMQSTLSQASIHTVEFISDGIEGVGDPPRTFQEYHARLRAAFSDGVAAIIQKQKAKVLVHDALMPWLLEVARADGLGVATFFTQPASVCAVYYHMLHGHIQSHTDDSKLRLPSLPELEFSDLPSFSYFAGIVEEVTEFNISQASNLPKADCFFINTFHSLEDQVVEWMVDKWAVKCVGPLVPIFHKTLHDEKQDRIDLFELEGESCIEWLDNREPKSVVYVSFGSVVVLTEEQMEHIAWALAQSNKHFIWVVRESEEIKLPKDFKVNEEGISTRKEIEDCIKHVTEERAEEFSRNVIKWKELAKEATSEGGSSYENIKDFVAFAKSYSE